MSARYFADVKQVMVFSEEGPQPQSLHTDGALKIIAVGLNAGQSIPVHPEGLAVYSFLEGNGWMVVDGERMAVGPGAVVITLAGAKRGIEAESRLMFIALRLAEFSHS
jgi:quercetin dioxygenase-like cupin family protein